MKTKNNRIVFKNAEECLEDFKGCHGYRRWTTLGRVIGHKQYSNDIYLKIETINGVNNSCCYLAILFLTPTTFRVRFDPKACDYDKFPSTTSRSVVKYPLIDVSKPRSKPTFKYTDKEPINLDRTQIGRIVNIEVIDDNRNDYITILVKDRIEEKIRMKVKIFKEKYRLEVYQRTKNGAFRLVHSDANTSIYYKETANYKVNGEAIVEYTVIQAKRMHKDAKYIGLREKITVDGGKQTGYNFENIDYKKINSSRGSSKDCNGGDISYETNGFFMEKRIDYENVIQGILVDNTCQTIFDMDIYNGVGQYIFGSVYGCLDYYYFLGENIKQVLEIFNSFIGKSSLKPRYIFGNHQGCYGYRNLYDLHDVVSGYRGNGIPLDGLHIDVDLQKNYCTFTMNEDLFPSDTFKQLAARGIKCATNVTPAISYTNSSYKTFESGKKNKVFVTARQVNDQSSNRNPTDPFYKGGVYYGGKRGAFSYYPNFGDKDVRYWWGAQYRMLMYRGLEMICQDMTTPRIADPKENNSVEIYHNKADKWYKLSDKIQSDNRSFPLNQLLTDNSQRNITNPIDNMNCKTKELMIIKSPFAKITNLYSYNMHKATYHGLNCIWLINPFVFTGVGEKGITKEDALEIIEDLKACNCLIDIEREKNVYNVDYFKGRKLKLRPKYKKYEEEVRKILEETVILRRLRRNKRNFILGQSEFNGTRRFSCSLSDRNVSEWNCLQTVICQVLGQGLAGQSISGQDIGGYGDAESKSEEWIDPELFIRWICAGCLLPWFKNNYTRYGNKLFQEPYKFKDCVDRVDENKRQLYMTVVPICRYYVQLRYRLMQIFYDHMFENHIGGLPIVKPLFITDENDTTLFKDHSKFVNDEFILGNDILVAPVLHREADCSKKGRRDVYLPSGNDWYAFKNNCWPLNEPVEGGSVIDYDAAINNDPDHIPFILPIYVRDGAIIPTIELEQYVGQLKNEGKPNPITLNIYPGRDRSYCMYNDDGESRSSAPKGYVKYGTDPEARSEYRKTCISHSFKDAKCRIVEIKWLHNNYIPFESYFYVAILDDPKREEDPLHSIRIKSKNFNYPINETVSKIIRADPVDAAKTLEISPTNAWYYNRNVGISFIKIFYDKELQNTTPIKEDETHRDSSPASSPTYQLLIKYK